MRRAVPLLFLLACGGPAAVPSPNGWSGVELAAPLAIPDLTLTDTDGQPYRLADATRGKVALVFFGYTHCPDICPVHLANIAAVLDKLDDAVQRDVVTIFITTDPARDSIPRLRAWVKQFHPRFVGLTGTPEELAAAQRAFGLTAAARLDVPDREYLVQHAGQVIAFGRDGMARAQYPFGTRQRDWARDLPRLVATSE
jgi:protein SCO1/2